MKRMRSYQENADDAILNELCSEELRHNNKCLIKMFCGTGKSLVMRRCTIIQDMPLIVYVFPSLSLISQFYYDYLQPGNTKIDLKDQANSNNHILNISSESITQVNSNNHILNIQATTDHTIIKMFLIMDTPYTKYILVTYQSYETLINNLNGIHPDSIIFDEAHHTTSPEWKKLIYERTQYEHPDTSLLFFTATPRNERGITMYDHTSSSIGDCGKMVYNYTYMDGLYDNYLNAFEVRVDLYRDNTLDSIFKCIARAIIESKNTRILTFHSYVNDYDASSFKRYSVNEFVTTAKKNNKFVSIFNTVLAEFPGHSTFWAGTTITIKSLDALVEAHDRQQILTDLDNTSGNNIYILSSCRTIGEGIDTKKANMVVFVDPKNSPIQIIQNIGRIVRKPEKNMEPATILLPISIDYEKYAEFADDPVARNHALREDMDTDFCGNFNPILNIISALKSEDPDIYDICLKYPTNFAPNEIKRHLKKHKTTVENKIGDGSAKDTLEYLLNTPIDNTNESTDNMISRIATESNICVEVHTDSIDTSVTRFNDTNPEYTVVRILKKDDEYLPLHTEPENSKKRIPKMNKKNRPKLTAKCEPEMNMLWKIGDITAFTRSLVIECEEIPKYDVWRAKLAQVDAYIIDHGKRPSVHDKNKDIKQLGKWLGNQISNYKNNEKIMSNPEIRNEWEQFVEKHKVHFRTNEEIWRDMLLQVDKYIIDHGKRPSAGDKNKDSKQLGQWLGNQISNYKNNEYIMSNPEIRNEWEQFVEKHAQIFSPKKKDMSLRTVPQIPSPNPTPRKETSEERRVRMKSAISILHQKYKTMTSANLSNMFKSDRNLWIEYHAISEENEKGFDEDAIPRNRIILELSKVKTKRPKVVVDMGCGKAHISKYFKENTNLIFYNYDHISVSSNVIECDIAHIPLEDNMVDYCILSLAMWGSNCQEYLREAYRILDSNGKLYIIEPTKRWSELSESGAVIEGTESCRLIGMLLETGFKVETSSFDKFSMIVCSRAE